MNNVIAINTSPLTIETKKQNKQAEQKQNHRYREGFMVARREGGSRFLSKKGEGIKKYK